MHRQCLRLVLEEAIGGERGAEVHDEIVHRAVSRVHKVCLVFEQLVDALNDVPFPEHYLVPQGHEAVLHVGPEPVYKVYAPVEERTEEFLLDVALVGEHLSVQLPREHLPHPLTPVVHVRACETECYHLTRVVAQQVELEAVAPSHRPLPVPGETGEDLVEIPPDVVADGDHRAVRESYPRAFTEGAELHEHHHLEEYMRHKLHETVVGNRVGKLTLELSADTVQVVLLEIAVHAEVVAYENGHYLTFGKPPFAVPVAFPAAVLGGQAQVFGRFGVQILVKIVYNTENFRNYVFGNHRLLFL